MSLPFKLYLLSDRSRMGSDPAGTIVSLWRAGLEALQWRERDLTPRESYQFLLDLTDKLELDHGRPQLFINDRVDLALALGIHLHLTETSLPTRVIRPLLPANRMLGRSIHSLESALTEEEESVDFLLFGPVYETRSKNQYGPPQGLSALRQVCSAVKIPVLAIGGVTPERVPECLAAGAAGVAVIGAVWGAEDPVRALRAFQRALGE